MANEAENLVDGPDKKQPTPEQLEDKKAIADILKSGAEFKSTIDFEDWNPMEKIPTLGVGIDLLPGMSVVGYFVKNEEIASRKFIHSKNLNERGIPLQTRHIFRDYTTSNYFGIWSVGELKPACDKLEEGELIKIHYIGRGINAKGQKQHNFKLSRPVKGLGEVPF